MPALNPSVLLGSQYYVNTEDTPDQIRAGIGDMARAGLKLVRIFLQWTHVEPRQGRWDWSQYDALFDAAAQGGIGVIITLTALHPPGWMRLSFGPQDQGPLDDLAYWARAREYVRRCVERYRAHPALHSWILSNEPQLFLDHSEPVLQQYRRFIEQRYAGDIEALNRHSFQQRDSFDQVSFSGADSEGGFSGYTDRLNWLAFMSFRLQQILGEIKDEIRAGGDTHPVHVNPHALISDIYSRGQSIWAEGRLVDFMGCSAHPSWHSTRFLQGRLHQSVALFADLTRGATRAPDRYFWVTELQGGTNIYSGLTYLGPTGAELRSWVWESIAAGAKGVVFWCFNARNSGFEAGEWGLLDQQNRPSRRLQEITKIAELLDQHQAVFAASRPAHAPVALLFSEATWKLGLVEGTGDEEANPRNALMGADALVGAWMACADAGLSVDILDEVDLQHGLAQGYPLLILPGCTALEEASLTALRAYVESGGCLLADGLCGYKQPDGWLRDAAQHPLNEVFQVSVADIQAVPESKTSQTRGAMALPVWFLQVSLEPEGPVDILAAFDEPDPRPALTLARFGRGRALRLGTVFFQHYFQHPNPAAFAGLLGQAPLPTPAVQLLNPGPHLRLRQLVLPGGGALWVLLNGAEKTSQALLKPQPGIRLDHLTRNGTEMLEWKGETLELSVPGQDAVVLRMPAGSVNGNHPFQNGEPYERRIG